jgi:putative ABC transport system permease protein
LEHYVLKRQKTIDSSVVFKENLAGEKIVLGGHGLGSLGFFLRMAGRSIIGRKFRSALTMLGVIIGIAAIVSLLTVGYGMRSQIESELNVMLGAGIVIYSRGGIDIPEYVSEYVSQIPGVNESVPVIMSTVRIDDKPVMAVGINPLQSNLFYVRVEEGRNLKSGEENVVVLSRATRDSLKVKVNDTITLNMPMWGVGETFKVVGISRSIGFGFGLTPMSIGCFLNLDAAQQLFERLGYVSAILVTLTDPALGEQVEKNLRSMFSNVHILRQEEIMREIDSIMRIVNGVLVALGSLSLGVGAIGIMNTVMMSVHERRREIGMLKAVGAERWHILTIFLSEALLISIVGGLLGCALGLASIYFIQWFVVELGLIVNIPVIVYPNVIGIGLFAAFSVGTFAGLYPSWKAANVRPVEALRYE